jgi:excisionase family DNA binding protein
MSILLEVKKTKTKSMSNIIFLDANETKATLQDFLKEFIIENQKIPAQSERPDRCDLSEAAIILQISKSQLYKLTFTKKIPFRKFGKKLVFSRRELLTWVEMHTISCLPDDDTITNRLRESAKKKYK